jgi:hypothetical protein
MKMVRFEQDGSVGGTCIRTFPSGRKERWQAPRVYSPLEQQLGRGTRTVAGIDFMCALCWPQIAFFDVSGKMISRVATDCFRETLRSSANNLR